MVCLGRAKMIDNNRVSLTHYLKYFIIIIKLGITSIIMHLHIYILTWVSFSSAVFLMIFIIYPYFVIISFIKDTCGNKSLYNHVQKRDWVRILMK